MSISISVVDNKKTDMLLNRIYESPFLFRNKLNLDNKITFGSEIEVNGVDNIEMYKTIKSFNIKHNLIDDDRYLISDDITVDSEVITPILTDTKDNWILFKDLFDTLNKTKATIGTNTSSHVHLGTHLINSNQTLSIFLKMLVVFEPIIFRFGYGYTLVPRDFIKAFPNLSNYATMTSPIRYCAFINALDNNSKDLSKRYNKFIAKSLNISSVYKYENFDFNSIGSKSGIPNIDDHMEVRCFNGSLDPVIVQNNINLIASILHAVLENRIDLDYLNLEYQKYSKRKINFDRPYEILNGHECIAYNNELYSFNKVDLNKVMKFTDMVFIHERDKYMFLKQYFKLFNPEDMKKKL